MAGTREAGESFGATDAQAPAPPPQDGDSGGTTSVPPAERAPPALRRRQLFLNAITSIGVLVIPIAFFAAVMTALDIPRVNRPALLVIENRSRHVLRNVSLVAGTTGVGVSDIHIREVGIGQSVVRSFAPYHETYFDDFSAQLGDVTLPKQGLAKGGSGVTVHVTVFDTDVSVVVQRSKE